MKIKYIFLIIAALNLVSCDNYLDTTPDNRTTLDSPEKVKELLVNAYPKSSYGMFCFSMSDNADDKGSGTIKKTNQDGYFWRTFESIDQDSPATYWGACYAAIAHANEALEYIETQNLIDAKGNKTINPKYVAYYGEALLARAYAHFMLVNLWGKTYNPATAKTDLGIPYVIKSEKTVLVQYKRASVAKVYENIEKDLIEGLPYINDNMYEVPKYHFNFDAAHAFASRFYLMKGEWSKVIKHSDLVLGDDPTTKLRDLNGSYQKLSLSEQEAQYNKADEPSVLLLSSTVSGWFNYFFAQVRYSMTYDMQKALFNNMFVDGTWALSAAAYGSEHKLMIKWGYFFKRASLNANTGWYYAMTPLFSTEEVLLNRAEAYAMLGQNSNAIADINAMLSKKVKTLSGGYDFSLHEATAKKITDSYAEVKVEFNLTPFYDATIKSRDILNCIIDIRRKEFYYEGHRWFDIRRFNLPVTHKIIEDEGADDRLITLESEDLRKQIQIPESVTAYGVAANPR